MPAQFADLLTVSGLVALTVLIMALLKATKGPEGSWVRQTTDWIRKNQFVTSLGVAVVVAGLAKLVQVFGYLPYAEEFWKGALFLWAVAQALYNGQKGLAHIIQGQPN